MTSKSISFSTRALAAFLTIASIGCGGGGSPTGPSTSPTSATTTPTTPAPVTLNLTGTWLLGLAPAFTLTQNGTTVTGTQIFAPITAPGIVITQSGTVSGTLSSTASGSTLTLSLSTTIVSAGTGELAGFAVSCKSTDKWVGTATNTSLTGTYTSGDFSCDGLGGITVPTITGPQNYTKQ